jgi:L-lactate dehydrogenase (cytochrome)
MGRAMAKLGHPDGEVNLTKGAASTGIIQVVSPYDTTKMQR